MKATHTDYKHPRHLRVEDGGEVFCMSPSCSAYADLSKRPLPVWDWDVDETTHENITPGVE